MNTLMFRTHCSPLLWSAMCLIVMVGGCQCSDDGRHVLPVEWTGVGLAPLLPNNGVLRLVHINEVSADGSGTVREQSAAAHFSHEGIEVCHVLNIICGTPGTSPTGTCTEAAAMADTFMIAAMVSAERRRPVSIRPVARPDSVKAVHRAIRAVLRLMPLDLRGPFTMVNTGQSIVNYQELSSVQRWDFLMAYQKEIQDLRWDSALNIFIDLPSKFRVQADSMRHKDLLDFTRYIPAVSDNRFSIAKKALGSLDAPYESEVRTVSFSMVCASEDGEDCFGDIVSYLSLFAQDQYHVRTDRARLLARNVPHGRVEVRARVQNHADVRCGSDGGAGLDPLPIKGGNYAVNGNLAFIGMDELSNFLTCRNWAGALGLELPTTREAIEEKLVGLMLGGDTTGRVIWVGDELVGGLSPLPDGDESPCNDPPVEQQYQPVYHTDLFFHPLGHLRGSKKWSYVISTLEDDLHPLARWRRADGDHVTQYHALKKRMKLQADRLYKDLKDLGIDPDPVAVPLLVDFMNGEIGDYVAFANGVSEHTGSAVRYFMPDYFWKDGDGLYVRARSRAKASLESRGVSVLLIPDSYTATSALHCKVKVMKRDPD
jgi:hypothetical protein